MLKVMVVGVGHWGKNLAQCFRELGNLEVLADINPATLDKAHDVTITQDYRQCLRLIDAVAISTPMGSHYEIARDCLEAGKHVLVEKPMCTSARECRELIGLAEKQGLVLMVGHTYLYNQAVRAMLQAAGDDCPMLLCHWQNLDPPRTFSDAVWNILPHPISIALHFAAAIKKIDIWHRLEKSLMVRLEWDKGHAFISADWGKLPKERHVTISNNKGNLFFTETSEKRVLSISNSSLSFLNDNPLKEECQHFIECIEKGVKPLTDGYQGLKVVEVLEKIERLLT